MKYDILFWYTGLIAWVIISLAVSLAVTFILVYSLYKFYQAALWYKGFYILTEVPEFESDEWYRVRYAFIEACEEANLELPEDKVKKLFGLINSKYRNYDPKEDGHKIFMNWGKTETGTVLTSGKNND
jgi:hypothetical protein